MTDPRRTWMTVAIAAGVFAFIVLAVMLAVFVSVWAMESAGLSMALGAFLGGLLLADSRYRHQIMADIQPFRGLLLGLFFMSVGMSITLCHRPSAFCAARRPSSIPPMVSGV